MEQITECLVKKQVDKFDILKKTAIVIFAFVGAILAMALAASVQILNSMGLFLAAVVVFFAYKFAQTTDVEFEYCIVNGEIDVDRIFDKKRRKRYISVPAGKIDKIVPIESDDNKSVIAKKTYFAAANRKDENNYVIIFRGERGYEKIIIVDDEKVLLHFLTVMPQKVQKRK